MNAIKVFLCGGPKSGKTVYLSALFNSLLVSDGKIGLRCETKPAVESILSAIYNNLPYKWPEGTRLTTLDLPLDLYLEQANAPELPAAARFDFFDYGGEGVDGGAAPSEDYMNLVSARAKECHVVMAVIDGALILESIEKYGDHPSPNLHAILTKTLSIWQANNSVSKKDDLGKKNRYFIVTKWDLFEQTDLMLQRVIKVLQRSVRIQQYLSILDASTIVRVIPVSAVGNDFAERDSSTGKMKVIAKHPMPPINIDVPLACLLPDILRAEMDRFEEEAGNKAHAIHTKEFGFWERISYYAGKVLENPFVAGLAHDFGIHPRDINTLADVLKDSLNKSQQQRDAIILDLLKKAKTHQEASKALIAYFVNTTKSYESKYPSTFTLKKN